MDEIELKLLLDAASERRLRSHGALRRMTRGRASTRRLRTVYFDTPDWRLRDAGIALRLREQGGSWVQSVKAGRGIRGGLSRAEEAEAAVDGPEPVLDAVADDRLRDIIRKTVKEGELAPRAETAIRRQKRTLEHAGTLIEFALDSGEVIAGDRREPLREAEFELIEGDPAALFEVAATVFDDGLVRFSTMSKGERGYRLATEGRSAPAPGPRKARRVALEPDMTTEEALQAILSECLEQIVTNAAAAATDDDSKGPHQLRVGLRRLRAALRLLPKDEWPPRFAFLADEARRLGQVAAEVRDLDVMREDVLAPVAGGLPEAGAAALDTALAERAEEARQTLRRSLAEAATQRFLLEVAAAGAAGLRRRRAGDIGVDRLEEPVGQAMQQALDRRWKRVRKCAKGIGGLTVEQRHELRKALKALRYTVEFAEPLWRAGRSRAFLKRMRSLQDVFGELNDVAMAEHVLMGDDPPAARDGDARLAAGLLIGAARVRAEHQWEGAKVAWKALKKEGPFWQKAPREAA